MEFLLGPVGYFVAATGFAALLLLLLTTYRQVNLQKSLLQLVCVSGAVWAGTTGLQLIYGYPLLFSLVTESLFNGILSLLLLGTIISAERLSEVIKHKLMILCGMIFLVATLEICRLLVPFLHQKVFFFAHLCQAIIGLWFIENLYRRSHRQELQAIKPICLGLGMIYGYNFALYADAFLTNVIAPSFWDGRGWIIATAIPLIVLTTRRLNRWASRVYVSRDVIYHSTLILVAGIYLLAMSIVSFFIKAAGVSWADTAQTIFFALSSLVLASLFLSSPLRRRLKVFIAKHFFANKYEYRQEWITFCASLEHHERSPYDNALAAMRGPFGCTAGLLASMKNGRLQVVSHDGCAATSPEATYLLEHLGLPAIEHDWIIDIEKLKAGYEVPPFSVEHDRLPAPAPFSVLVPVHSDGGFQGVFLLSRPTSTDTVDWEDRDLMHAIGSQLAVYLTMYEANQKLAESQQFDTFNRMSSFLVHDLKNVVAQLQLLSRNAARHKHNPEFIDDAFDTVESAVNRLNNVLSQLRSKRIDADSTQHIEIAPVIAQVCQTRSVQEPCPVFRDLTHEPIRLDANKERFENILNHLIQNAQDATDAQGQVDITLQVTGNHCQIEITDNGHGMSQDFIQHRLFKPFDTTKGNAGMGIGAYDAKNMIEQLGGHVTVQSAPEQGTRFVLEVPLSTRSPQKNPTILKE